jgi:hypothetical protein
VPLEPKQRPEPGREALARELERVWRLRLGAGLVSEGGGDPSEAWAQHDEVVSRLDPGAIPADLGERYLTAGAPFEGLDAYMEAVRRAREGSDGGDDG